MENAGAKLLITPADTESFQIDFEAFEKLLSPKTKGIIINSPNNPRGVVYSEDTIIKLSKVLCKKEKEYGHTIYLIADEPYREIVYDGLNVPYIPKYYNAVSYTHLDVYKRQMLYWLLSKVWLV